MTDRLLEGKRILLVEDEFLIALDIADTLTNAGAEVIGPCTSLRQALDHAGMPGLDLAMLDIDLNGEEVFPAASLLRKRGVPFLFYTGQPEREVLRTEFAEIPVCVKPVTPQRLIDTLARMMALAA
ncbi:response regulator [Pelagibacterium sp. 26DY04]|uniref:response regulator n=1 Tax=Pelagibacterium sp. 26DY04 TaxID=2967130 RepID=UPI002814D484|nr:response regulator [Pelagibacterium sp. 26DY04]WMT87767.1 response regulator [Pelagibacterium sp. 26DY04]